MKFLFAKETTKQKERNTLKNEDIIFLQKFMLTTSGIWPLEKGHRSIIHACAFFTSWVTLFMVIADVVYHLYKLGANLDKITEAIFAITQHFALVMKMGSYYLKRENIRNIMEQFKSPDMEVVSDEQKEFINIERDSVKTVAKLNFTGTGIGALMSICYAFFNNVLPFDLNPQIEYFFDLEKYYYLIFFIEVFTIITNAWNHLALDSSIAAFISVGNAQVEILMYNIKNIRNSALELWQKSNLTSSELETRVIDNLGINDANEQLDFIISKLLAKEIRRHSAIIKYVHDIETFLSLTILTQFSETTFGLCISIYQILLVSKLAASVLYMIPLLVQIFLYCYYGQKLISKSGMIRDACYQVDWVNCGPLVRKNLLIIMETSKKPLSIRGVKLFPLSLNSFGSVMKTTYSVFTLLQSIIK